MSTDTNIDESVDKALPSPPAEQLQNGGTDSKENVNEKGTEKGTENNAEGVVGTDGTGGDGVDTNGENGKNNEENGIDNEENGNVNGENGADLNSGGDPAVSESNSTGNDENGESLVNPMESDQNSLNATENDHTSQTSVIETSQNSQPPVTSHLLPNRPSRSHSVISHSSTINTHASIGFLKVALEKITSHSREMKKQPRLQKSCALALEKLESGIFPETKDIFEPLRLASQSANVDIKLEALECLGKSFNFNVFDEPSEVLLVNLTDTDSSTPAKTNLIDAAIETIADCFEGEGTNEKVELQVVRGLMLGALNENLPAHGGTLLRAVRQIYNIFILSLSLANQNVAQLSLTQIVSEVFERINKVSHVSGVSKRGSIISASGASNSGAANSATATASSAVGSNGISHIDQPVTLNTFENADDDQRVEEANKGLDDDENVEVKDAFLLFRAMSKLSVKSLDHELLDMRSHPIRSKLLSLHIIYNILKQHLKCFTSNDVVITSSTSLEETRLIDAVRQYICLTLSRNSASSLTPVFEISLEIFWILLSDLRSEFKREIPVFFTEIYFPVLEMKTSTPHQKRYWLSIVQRLCDDPKAVIEIYLNYDCDSAMPNITESLVDYLTKLSLTRAEVTPTQKVHYRESLTKPLATYDLSTLPLLSINRLGSSTAGPNSNNLPFPVDYALKMSSIDCIVAFLRSLSSWTKKFNHSQSGTQSGTPSRSRNVSMNNISAQTPAQTPDLDASAQFYANNSSSSLQDETGDSADSRPLQFETSKLKKKLLLEGVRQFNFKPKRGIQTLIRDKFIENDTPESIARFLLEGDYGINKTVLGEFLGEGDEKNIAIMHLFVESMDFTQMTFVDAMRVFLQKFRLPGESQKIDRFMLKFAERYVDNNPNTFANADTAYILLYSVIMLNTDQHSPQVKSRMTVDEFIKNNAGIDDGQDLPHDYLVKIYEEIQNNEIKLKSEQHQALISGDLNVTQQSSGFFGSRDVTKEQYIQLSREMSTKTEQLVRTLGRVSKDGSKVRFFELSPHLEHVRSIFDTMWMSILAGLTPPFKEYNDEDTSKICLEGIKLSIHISCMFELDYARTSFIGALVQFANLNNLEEMDSKNMLAIYLLLEVAVSEGNVLRSSWKEILISISQIERIQLLAQGIDSFSVPDIATARLANRSSIESSRTNGSASGQSFFSSFSASLTAKRQTPSQIAFEHHQNQQLNASVVPSLTSTDLEVAIDKVFSTSNHLVGDAIIDFVKLLTEVSSEEIESSGQSESPRMFSLQKMVDVCYYNMDRIRVQWSQLWAIMGQLFNNFGCHNNRVIVLFALDSLRQLSMRFFEIEELSHFKFQKEFLKPFAHIIRNNDSLEIKERVLESLNYMIQVNTPKIKSGWITMFDTFTIGAKDGSERIVSKVMAITSGINKTQFDDVYLQGGFHHLVACFTELLKNQRFQKSSLHALSILKQLMQKVSKLSFGTVEERKLTKETGDDKDVFTQLWFPVLYGYHDVIMTGEDLEVRSELLNFMFDSLVNYGGHFESEFWYKICNQLLFPIFGVLSKRWEINQFNSNDDMSVWLSTTLIQLLRNMIALFTHYFDTLNNQLDGYLNLLVSCICQENDTIARIGRSCLQQLIKQNMSKFSQHHWDKITDSFDQLFELTTARELFKADPLNNGSYQDTQEQDLELINAGESSYDVSNHQNTVPSPTAIKTRSLREGERLQKSREKSTIVVKCVLQLLMIETVSELFEDDAFYSLIPLANLISLAALLEKSYKFSKEFNDDYNLRVRLWNSGVIERLPNLLKQESSSSLVYISIMFRLYCDTEKVSAELRAEISSKLIPMCITIIERYVVLDEVQQQRNITTWRPVVVEILQGYDELNEQDFVKNCPAMYDLVLQILDKSAPVELRAAIKTFLARVGAVYLK